MGGGVSNFILFDVIFKKALLATECARDRLHPGSESSVGLPGQQKLYVRRSHMWPEPHHDELHTFRSLDDIAEMKDGYVRWLRAIEFCVE